MGAHQRKPGFLGRLVEERARRGAAKRRRGRACHRILPLLEILDDRVLLSANPIVTENQLPGHSRERLAWSSRARAIPALQGFTTDISVDVGQTVSFKITDTTLDPYAIDIYRIGYYQGRWRTAGHHDPVVPGLGPEPAGADRTTPRPGKWDAGNWAVSASWAVPSTAVSGVYLADLVDQTTGGHEHDRLRRPQRRQPLPDPLPDRRRHLAGLQRLGRDRQRRPGSGNSLYTGNGPSSYQGAAYAVSYNRPLNNYNNTSEDNYHDEFFYAEFPMVEWLEENGYDVSYFTDVDADRSGSLIQNHQIWIDAGHDEYWSGNEFNNLLAARNAGVNLAFFSGNAAFWKTYYSNSIDGSNTADRTLVCYKETHPNAASASTRPTRISGPATWADPRFSPPADGGIGQNELTGTFFDVNQGPDPTGTPITVPGDRRQSSDLAQHGDRPARTGPVDEHRRPGAGLRVGLGRRQRVPARRRDRHVVDHPERPARSSSTGATRTAPETADPQPDRVPGQQRRPGLRRRHGAVVLGPLEDHYGTDSLPDPDPNMQQATVNLFADMGAQPGTLQAGLVPATQTALSSTPPTSAITWPPPGASLPSGTPVTITGTASAAAGAFVVGVEVSTDGGQTWNPAQGTTNWSYTWTPGATGPVTIMSRAVDDTVHLGNPSTGVTVTVTQPATSLTLFGLGATPTVPAANDPNPNELGVRFSSDISGYITGIRFYKGPGNVGTHVGHLWTSTGTLLASVTFTDESISGWQEADFSTPVAITAGTTYVASYYAPDGDYAADTFYFAQSGVNSGPLHVPLDLPSNPASVFLHGAEGFPTTTFHSTNYWVDVVFSPTATSLRGSRASRRRRAPTGSPPTPPSPPSSMNRSRWGRSRSC